MCRSKEQGGRRCALHTVKQSGEFEEGEFDELDKTRSIQLKLQTTTTDVRKEGRPSARELRRRILSPNAVEDVDTVLASSREIITVRKEIQRDERAKAAGGAKGGAYARELEAAPSPSSVYLTPAEKQQIDTEAEINGHKTAASYGAQKVRGESVISHTSDMGERFMAEREVWFEMNEKQRELIVKTRNTAAQGIRAINDQLAELEIGIIALQGADKDSEEYKTAGEMMKARKALTVEKNRLLEERKEHESAIAEQQAKVRAFFQNSARALSFLAQTKHRKGGAEFGQFFILGMAGVAQLAAPRKVAK